MNSGIYIGYIFCSFIFFVLGCLVTCFKYGTVNGIIEVDDENESYYFKMSSEDIKNPKNNRIIFMIQHKNNSQN